MHLLATVTVVFWGAAALFLLQALVLRPGRLGAILCASGCLGLAAITGTTLAFLELLK